MPKASPNHAKPSQTIPNHPKPSPTMPNHPQPCPTTPTNVARGHGGHTPGHPKHMSWSTKRRNSRPSLTNSTRPSPRCPATKKIFYHPTNFPNFFLRKFHFFEIFYHQISKFCSTTFLYVFPPIPKTFQKNEIILFSHGSFWMR